MTLELFSATWALPLQNHDTKSEQALETEMHQQTHLVETRSEPFR